MRQAKVGILGQRRAWAGGLLLVGLTAPAVHVGCSSSFSGCQDTRTCNNDPGAEAGAGGEQTEPQAGGASGSGGSQSHEGGAAVQGGAGPDGVEGGEGGTVAPGGLSVVSTSPTTDATGAELDTSIDITFSEPIDPDTVTTDSVQILDGDTVVEGTLNAKDDVVTFMPAEDFALLADYTIRVTTDVTSVDDTSLSEDFTATFETRDGTWHSVELASGTFDTGLARNLPITATGDTLLSWSTRSVGDHCSTTVRWFNRGKWVGPQLLLNAASTAECAPTRAAANADGLGAVMFGTYDPSGDELFNYEFREGDWTEMPLQFNGANSLAISPSGLLFNFFPTTSGMAMVTGNGNGGWLPSAPEIAPDTWLWSSPAAVFNANNEGFAVWTATEVLAPESYGPQRILAARYSAASGSWLEAVTLPGSLATMKGSAYRRGAPVVAVDPQGGAMALWVLRESKKLMMNRYTPGDGWSDAAAISGNLVVDDLGGEPGLVFDGQTFVAAWTAETNGSTRLYTSRFDMAESTWPEPEVFVASKVAQPRPSLGVDGHGNLLMTWVTATDDGSALYYARYHAKAGTWNEGQPVPDGAIGEDTISSFAPSPLGVNHQGIAALQWGAGLDSTTPSTLYYSSFH